MRELIIVIDILAGLGLIVLVLLQQGKGADMGAAFGSGASATLFGSRGTANFLTRTTAVLATVFFVANLALAYLASSPSEPASVTREIAPSAPAAPPAGTPSVPQPPPAAPSVPDVPK
ncbi:preprotein translocase subunit SecG [Sulfurifustis variabilis]|uniref:Protein-export membrane protein SecG n=1 Tax=Sulfurifustis variabilis TaxID=1675686 RepID=A0A1B4V633_9GAMM|nr:preprotein translocase subunit SecG [Sulfurifustis variabilis]BAU48968.1 preprotein translocase subunit SecG [Sulfurifustis variabilis]